MVVNVEETGSPLSWKVLSYGGGEGRSWDVRFVIFRPCSSES